MTPASLATTRRPPANKTPDTSACGAIARTQENGQTHAAQRQAASHLTIDLLLTFYKTHRGHDPVTPGFENVHEDPWHETRLGMPPCERLRCRGRGGGNTVEYLKPFIAHRQYQLLSSLYFPLSSFIDCRQTGPTKILLYNGRLPKLRGILPQCVCEGILT